jgi:A/G-specific adenine glycosylase
MMLTMNAVQTRVIDWYHQNARELPWRSPDRTPWGVLVSEIMLAQTPVARVEPAWVDWMRRWPVPAALAADQPAAAIRHWDRLGYPRRALWLHQSAVVCVERFDGEVPQTYEELRALPGVGDYTASAVLAFAYGRRSVVLDTNVRRVLARIWAGSQYPAASITSAERAMADACVPADDETAAQWSVAAMELGALICTSASPRCGECPVQDACAWNLAGKPAYDGPPRKTQKFAGTDRQVRGKLMAALRQSTTPVTKGELDLVWPDAIQRERALDALIADGLVDPVDDDRFTLPTKT